MNERVKKGLRTSLIILGIYVLFVLYLLLVSDRVEKLDHRSKDEPVEYALKIGK